MDSDRIHNLYSIYKEKLDRGEYIIPPLYIVEDIIINRYGEDRVSISNGSFDDFPLGDLNTIKEFEWFERYLEYLNKYYTRDIEDMISNDRFLVEEQYIPIYDLAKEFTVYYPEIIITNSTNKSHVITDLYVRFSFNYFGRLRHSFKINRGSYSDQEWNSSYKHSHTRGSFPNEIDYFSNPCLGSGPINSNIAILKSATLESFSELEIVQFLILMDDFLKWESLEGVPYKYIRDIGGGGSYTLSLNRSPKELRISENRVLEHLVKETDFLEHVKEHAFLIPTVKDGTPKYSILFNEWELQKILFSYYQEDINVFDYPLTNILMYKDSLNRVYYKSGTGINLPTERYEGRTLFTFKGHDVKLKIHKTITEEVEDFCINPEILYYLINKLEMLINLNNAENSFSKSEL